MEKLETHTKIAQSIAKLYDKQILWFDAQFLSCGALLTTVHIGELDVMHTDHIFRIHDEGNFEEVRK